MIEEIIEQIDAEIKLKKDRIDKNQIIMDYYKEVRKSIKTKKILPSPTDYVTIALVGDKVSDFLKIENDMQLLKPLLDKINNEDIKKLILELNNILGNNKKINIFQQKKIERIILKYCNNNINIKNTIELLLKYMDKYNNQFIYAILLLSMSKNISSEYVHPKELFLYKKEMDYIELNIESIIRNRNHIINENKKIIKQYEDLKKIIVKFKDQDDIIRLGDYKATLNNIKNEDIKRKILIYIYMHNTPIQNALIKLNMQEQNNFLVLLSKYNIKEEEINIDKIMKLTYKSLNNILNQITKYFNNKEIIIKILENISSENTFNQIIDFIKNGIMQKQVLINYPKVLDEHSKEHKSLMENYQYLTYIGINPMMFINSPEAIINNDFLKENIAVLKQYDLINYMKSGSNLNYLKNPKLAEKIDISLEIGLENELENNLEILNNENLKRLILIKNIGTIPYRIKDIYEIIEKNKFSVPDQEIDKYIINYTIYIQKECEIQNDNSEIPELEEYSEGNSRVYIIGGLLISKNRVKRYYDRNSEDKKEALFQAIIHNTILNEEEINEIKAELTKKIKRK